MTEQKKYGSSTQTEKILSAPVTKKPEPEPQPEPTAPAQKEPSLTETIDLSIQSISDVITILDSLPRVDGRLPDRVVLALGKLHGALIHLRK